MNGRTHEVALWAAVVSFFGTLLAIGVFDVINPDQWVEYLGAIFVGAITAGSVYAKGRLDDARRKETELRHPPTTYQKPR